jgi:hypothetical protein
MIDGGWRLTLKAPAIVTIGDGVAEASIVPDLGAGLAGHDLMIHGDYDYAITAITVTPITITRLPRLR